MPKNNRIRVQIRWTGRCWFWSKINWKRKTGCIYLSFPCAFQTCLSQQKNGKPEVYVSYQYCCRSYRRRNSNAAVVKNKKMMKGSAFPSTTERKKASCFPVPFPNLTCSKSENLLLIFFLKNWWVYIPHYPEIGRNWYLNRWPCLSLKSWINVE